MATMSRVTQGVRLISLKEDQKVTAVFNIEKKKRDSVEEEGK